MTWKMAHSRFILQTAWFKQAGKRATDGLPRWLSAGPSALRQETRNFRNKVVVVGRRRFQAYSALSSHQASPE